MTVDVRHAAYVPTIFLRSAELLAIKELPESAKDALCPIFCLKPWRTAKLLSSAMDQISNAYGDRPFFLDILPFVEITEVVRQAQEDFRKLISPENGNINWVNFFEKYPNANPCIIVDHGDVDAVRAQTLAFSGREKFFLVRFEKSQIINFGAIVDVVCELEHSNFGFVIDAGWSRNLLMQELWVDQLVKKIVEKRGGDVPIVLTGSSFPGAFSNYSFGESISLRERALFDKIKSNNNQALLVYGDWASSRSPTEGGGGNPIPPRIDLPTNRTWEIYRSNSDAPNYVDLARSVIKSPNFPAASKFWGTFKVLSTAQGAPNGITDQRLAAAVRINMHLFHQLHFGERALPIDTDDDFKE